MKLTTLLFGLLLAVGWTGSAFAQAYTFKEADAKNWTYSWTDASGTPHENVDPTLKVTDATQMYYFLRHVYMDKRFPGPFYSAYKADGVTREREVYYGGMDSGWDIDGVAIGNTSTTSAVGNITINMSNGNYSFQSIVVKSGSTVLTEWSYADDGTSLPSGEGWSTTTNFTSDGNGLSVYMSNGGTITIPASKLNGATNVTVEIYGRHDPDYSNDAIVTVAGSTGSSSSQTFTQSANTAWATSTWTVNGNTTGGDTGIGDIEISGTNNNAVIKSITVTSGGTTLFSWSYANNFTNFTPGMTISEYGYYYNTSYGIYFNATSLTPVILQGWLFDGYSTVTVNVTAFTKSNASASGNLTINNDTRTVNTTSTSGSTYSWTVNARTLAGPTMYQADTYKPTNEGYTALIVKLKNNKYIKDDEPGFFQQCFYDSKDSIVSYLSRNVESIQLMTDGLRIGSGDKVGTVFNAPIDEYNKFFFLSKGQARQKSDIVIQEQVNREHLLGENVPFAQMFEQFSPTGGKSGDQITDFYSEMIQGKVYRIVHDCLSVIQNEHEFSMSGKTGTTPYKMSGMNFFIPDHRLQYWELTDTLNEKVTDGSSTVSTQVKAIYTVDGRDMNPYQPAASTKTNDHSTFYRTPSALAVWYAQYDTAQHAPLVGLYLLSLEAEAVKAEGYSEDYRYYNVDLDWTSSLNEMSNSEIPQTYIIYQVTTDSITGDIVNVPIDTVENITELRLDTLYQQKAHSYTLTYVIQGSPTDSEHPGFVAWSNTATVIIPGYDDFMILNLHHYESDFDVNYTVEAGKNYYRNYMYPENDIANGITAEAIKGGYDSFILYRTSTKDGKVPVAKLKLGVNSQNKVVYKITYYDENEDYNGPNNINIDAVIQQLINN